MGQTSTNVEVSGAESNVDYDGPTQEVSEEKDISKCPRNCSCDILAKSLPKAK